MADYSAGDQPAGLFLTLGADPLAPDQAPSSPRRPEVTRLPRRSRSCVPWSLLVPWSR